MIQQKCILILSYFHLQTTNTTDLFIEGGGGGGITPGWYFYLKLVVPIGLSPLTLAFSLNPSFHGGGAVPLLSLPGLSLPPYSPFLSLRRLCHWLCWEEGGGG